MDQATRSFREHYRSHEVSKYYSGTFHILFNILIAGTIMSFCSYKIAALNTSELVTVPITLLYANFIEYLVHRGPMHNKLSILSPLYQHTTLHHRFYTDIDRSYEEMRDMSALFFPFRMIFFLLGLIAIPHSIILGKLIAPNVGYLFYATTAFYYLSYEFLHFTYHLKDDDYLAKTALIKYLRKGHTHHHNPKLMRDYNFNVTFPIFDWLFKTLYR